MVPCPKRGTTRERTQRRSVIAKKQRSRQTCAPPRREHPPSAAAARTPPLATAVLPRSFPELPEDKKRTRVFRPGPLRSFTNRLVIDALSWRHESVTTHDDHELVSAVLLPTTLLVLLTHRPLLAGA